MTDRCYQLVFRLKRTETPAVPDTPGFRACFTVGHALPLLVPLFRRLGPGGLVKDLVKLATRGRHYFCIVENGRIVSDAYVVVGRCRHYDVEPDAAVIGPVWTADEARGKGLATRLLQQTMAALQGHGCSTFYIDTSDKNAAMLAVIEKCGFGQPVQRIEKRGAIG